jgi:hypothetical protein
VFRRPSTRTTQSSILDAPHKSNSPPPPSHDTTMTTIMRILLAAVVIAVAIRATVDARTCHTTSASTDSNTQQKGEPFYPPPEIIRQ